VLGFVLLSGGSDGDGERAAQPTPTATAERTPEPTPTKTPKPKATATATPTTTPEATSTAEPAAEPDLGRAADLQIQGFNARRAGNYEQALTLSEQALQACGDAQELNPCGYALYEVGTALNALGRPAEAIPYLEQRLNTYGNNADVRAELKKARKAAKGAGS
jgi:tetratricopeptide (TPR) repeat protein